MNTNAAYDSTQPNLWSQQYDPSLPPPSNAAQHRGGYLSPDDLTNLRLYLEFLALETLKSSERQINQLWSSVAEKRKGFKNILKGFVGVRRGGEVEWQTLCLAAGLCQMRMYDDLAGFAKLAKNDYKREGDNLRTAACLELALEAMAGGEWREGDGQREVEECVEVYCWGLGGKEGPRYGKER